VRKKSIIMVFAFLLILVLQAQIVSAASILKMGSRGSEVQKMQQRLKELGFLSGAADGIFGRATKNAVESFQRSNGLKVDGIAGSNTLGKLYATSGSPGESDQNSRSDSTVNVITKTLRLGARGSDVKALQQLLTQHGFPVGSIDGVFGNRTLEALKSFQKSRGLTADGIAGKRTLEQLYKGTENRGEAEGGLSSITRTLKAGCRGDDVKALQRMLNELGFQAGTADGIFGSGTKLAVMRFQSDNGLKADGVVGKMTLAKLSAFNSPVEDGSTGGGSESAVKGIVKVAILNVRKGPGASYPKLGQVSLNTELAILEELSSGWCKVKWNNTIAYVLGHYLDIEREAPGRGDDERPVFEAWKPASGKINLVWQYNPSSMDISAEGINVVAPVWFDVALVNNQITITGARASKEYVDAAHANGWQVWGTIQSFNSDYSKKIVTDQTVGDHIIGKMVEIVQNYGFDGINIDFEKMDPNDKFKYTDFVARAASSLHNVGATVSVDVNKRTNSTTNWWSSCYDRAGLAQVADYVMLMSYDQYTHSSASNGPAAAIGWVEDALQLTLEEVPAEKLLLGVPTFTYDWYLVPNKANPDINNPADYTRPSSSRAITMEEAYGLAQQNETVLRSGEVIKVQEWIVSPYWRTDTGTMYMKFVDSVGRIHEIWYEDAQSIGLKLDLVSKYNLAGAATWQYLFADDDIWNTYREKLGTAE
jgi:peptidoglycan hydrolase-like protein with peptidoglycan-binding domain/spore germination protein YaaH